MKALHRPDLFCWSVFNERLDIDFNSFLVQRPGGNVLIDPLPLSAHDLEHLQKLGGAAWVLVTNSDHIRAAREAAAATGAKLAGPAGEKDSFPFPCDRWLRHEDELVPGLLVLEMRGSKTPGELCVLLDDRTLITGDLVRAHRPGRLMMLAKEKLKDPAAAAASVRRLLDFERVDAVLVGDGWCIFRDAQHALDELASTLT